MYKPHSPPTAAQKGNTTFSICKLIAEAPKNWVTYPKHSPSKWQGRIQIQICHQACAISQSFIYLPQKGKPFRDSKYCCGDSNTRMLNIFKKILISIFGYYCTLSFMFFYSFLDSLIKGSNTTFEILIMFSNEKMDHRHISKQCLISFDSKLSVRPPRWDCISVPGAYGQSHLSIITTLGHPDISKQQLCLVFIS